jgi:hypothetical protein
MRTGYAFLAVLSLSLTQYVRANIYLLKDEWVGDDFYQGWNWETEDDPTHGRVNYVSQAEAISNNLTCGACFLPPYPLRTLVRSPLEPFRPINFYSFNFFSGRK